MNIRNDYIEISIDGEKFTFKNMILKEYLSRLASAIVYKNRNVPVLNVCYLKFDKKLGFNENSVLKIKDFDKKCVGRIANQTYNEKEGITTYLYVGDDMKSYVDKKITAIGFFEEGIDSCLACINTYGLGLVVDSPSNFYVERKDTIGVEAEFTTKYGETAGNKIDRIVHIIPGEQIIDNEVVYSYYLGAIGLGDKNDIQNLIDPIRIDTSSSKLEQGLVEIGDVIEKQQYSYIWFIFYAVTHDVGNPSNFHTYSYYIKKPIENFDYFKASIKIERNN